MSSVDVSKTLLQVRSAIVVAKSGVEESRPPDVRSPMSFVLYLSYFGVPIRLGFAILPGKKMANTGLMLAILRQSLFPDTDAAFVLAERGLSWEAYQLMRSHGAEALLVKEALQLNWPAYLAALRLRKLESVSLYARSASHSWRKDCDGKEVWNPPVVSPLVRDQSTQQTLLWRTFLKYLLQTPPVLSTLMNIQERLTEEAAIDLSMEFTSTRFGSFMDGTRHSLSCIAMELHIRKSLPFKMIPPGGFIGAEYLPRVFDEILEFEDDFEHTVCSLRESRPVIPGQEWHQIFGPSSAQR